MSGLEEARDVSRWKPNLLTEAGKEFSSLMKEVDKFQYILKDLVKKPSDDHEACLVRNEMREVICDVEDAYDSWLTAKRKSYKFQPAALIRGQHNHDEIFVKKAKHLREGKVKEVSEKAIKLKTSLGSVTTTNEQEMNSSASRLGVVGRKDEKKKITGYLLKVQPQLDIISVIGKPGLGKTTLAWEIFNEEGIRNEFPIRIWVDITRRFNIKDVFLQIMKHFTDDLTSMSDQELLNAVHACLSRNKFLLVIDDLWKAEHWDDIRSVFPHSNGNSKVLITSREMGVGRHVVRIEEFHHQSYLNPEESWALFQLEVFGEIGRCPVELHEIGQTISKKCEGVPLTIVEIGGVLKDYLSLESKGMVRQKWEEMLQEIDGKFQYDAIALSYNTLPLHLSDCFLYLGVFPAGYEIPTWTLKRLWIVEGYIQPDEKGKRSLEKVAEDNLNDLISRNLLMVCKMNPTGEVKICVVHNMIRRFCIAKAVELNIFQEIKMEEENTGTLVAKMENIRRLCLHSNLDKFFSANINSPRVRSFLCFRKDVVGLNSVFTKNFTSLRVFHSKSIEFNKFPKWVTKLDHLRYIVLYVPDLKTLPKLLSQIRNLETIVVDTNSKSIKMKANLWEMIRLRHVKTKAAIILDKKLVEGEAGKSLQTLNRLSPESVTAVVYQKASNLKTLGIRGELAPLFDDMSLDKLNHLEKLKLYHEAASENQLRLRHFPEYNRFPPNLKRLTLSKTFLDWKHMSTLAMISNLEVLKLKDNAFTGVHWGASSCRFKNLKFLLIIDTNLVLWDAVSNTFPRLRHLVLKKCENLKEIPDCVLQHLENLEIERVSQSAADSARNFAAQFKLNIVS